MNTIIVYTIHITINNIFLYCLNKILYSFKKCKWCPVHIARAATAVYIKYVMYYLFIYLFRYVYLCIRCSKKQTKR